MINLTPHAKASHWGALYLGRPWSKEFNCWHLVQAVQREQFGREMPLVAVGAGEPSRQEVLQALLRHNVWYPLYATDVAAAAREGDVLVLRNGQGPHVGVIVRQSAHPSLIHNIGGEREDGSNWGSVFVDELSALGFMGYGHLQLWRAR